MRILAHSARHGYSEQLYLAHVSEVSRLARLFASHILPYVVFQDLLISTVEAAAEYHDLGKLDNANQRVLREEPNQGLPVKHEDAGTAFLLGNHLPSALCVYSHHRGLPSIAEERKLRAHSFRDTRQAKGTRKTVKDITDEYLDHYLLEHRKVMSSVSLDLQAKNKPNNTLFYRMALSCLVDADHTDTGQHYGGEPYHTPVGLLPSERLACLKEYVSSLSIENGIAPERLAIRKNFFSLCLEEPQSRGIYACSMPVGTGKTTSVMAHLLRAAEKFQLRRIFVVLPFTNIINQSVNTYRDSLVRYGEDRESIVAAHHHRAEYKNELLMASSFRWNAPITVTTAVQFFETITGSETVTLRKLHNLPGSAIFIDEAHAALPAHLWPQAWKSLQDLVDNWGCHIVLGSGSLSHFWDLEEFSDSRGKRVPEITGSRLFQEAFSQEINRVSYHLKEDPMDLKELCEWVCGLPGPRVIIVNTVQSAAAIANCIADSKGRDNVEHLSTALTPLDRESTIKKIKARLKADQDKDWTFVATTCAEAGLNFSFRSGAREMSSLASSLQLGGRVNRECEYGPLCDMWCFYIKKGRFLRDHKQFRTSARVLRQLFEKNLVSAEHCTEALRRELRESNVGMAKDDPIIRAENHADYPMVSELFQVIEDDQTFTVIVDECLKDKMERFEKPTRKEMQTLTVKMRKDQIEALRLPQVGPYLEVFFCYQDYYDGFLGYMKGILQMTNHLDGGSIT